MQEESSLDVLIREESYLEALSYESNASCVSDVIIHSGIVEHCLRRFRNKAEHVGGSCPDTRERPRGALAASANEYRFGGVG